MNNVMGCEGKYEESNQLQYLVQNEHSIQFNNH